MSWVVEEHMSWVEEHSCRDELAVVGQRNHMTLVVVVLEHGHSCLVGHIHWVVGHIRQR